MGRYRIVSDFPICPYCTYEHYDVFDWGMNDGDTENKYCDNCGKEFFVLCRKTENYTTSKIGKDNKDD